MADGRLKPDYRTIIRFRSDNAHVLQNVLKQCAQVCIRLKFIAGNTLFIDGTKIAANASMANTWTEERCQKALAKIDDRIAEILSESEKADQEEADLLSMVKLPEELKDQKKRNAKLMRIMDELAHGSKEYVNSTDPDCRLMHEAKSSCAGYNAQLVVDEKHGLVVRSDVVSDHNDLHPFSTQLKQANDTLERAGSIDAGYSNAEDLAGVDAQTIIIVPSKKQVSKKEPHPFLPKI